MNKPFSSALLILSLVGVLSATGQTPTPDACLSRVLAMNEIARGWQERALAAEAELAKIRAKAELAKAREQADRVRLDALASQSYLPPSSLASTPSEYRPAPSSSSSSTAKTEYVRGYVRKNGTVVQPYMRRPRSR